MRVRFRQSVTGIYGGIKLSQYLPGMVYEVPDAIGFRLLAMGAELIGPDTTDTEPLLTDEQLIGGVNVIQAEAADRPRRRRIPGRRRP